MSAPLWVAELGVRPYEEALELQRALGRLRRDGAVPDLLLLLEHPPVYTKGRRSEPGELPMGEDWYRMQGIEIAATDRGGLVTYHGPGQLVAYPILDLGPGGDVGAYVRRLERVMIEALGGYGIEAEVFGGLTGVWTAGEPPVPVGTVGPQGTVVTRTGPEPAAGSEARKIGSIGVHLSRGITTHGLAINVNNDLQPFEWIVPCGMEHVRMTSVGRELGSEQDMNAFRDAFRGRFCELFAREPEPVGAEALADLGRRSREPGGVTSQG